MYEELRRCNYLGDIHSIYSFAQIAIKGKNISYNSIVTISKLNTSINVKIKPCLLFFVEIGLLTETNGAFRGTELGLKLINDDFELFIKGMSIQTFEFLINNNYIASDAFIYDYNSSTCQIKRSGVSFTAAVFRNFLLDSGALIEYDLVVYKIGEEYESIFEAKIKKHRSKMTIEQLLEQHKRQEEQGRKAEEFVVEYEKKRLLWSENSSLVKQISDFDVSAGYDIISFDDPNSKQYNRFIEVKSYSSAQSFYWSANEMRVARKKKSQYYLYLVDMEQYQNRGYEPTIVSDPIGMIIDSEDWIIDTASIKVTRV